MGTMQQATINDLMVFDNTALAKIVGNRVDLQKKLLKKFADESGTRIDALFSASQRDNSETVRQEAHSLKSSARAVGAMQLGKLCEQMEEAGREADTERFQKLGVELDDKFEEAVKEINAWLDKDG